MTLLVSLGMSLLLSVVLDTGAAASSEQASVDQFRVGTDAAKATLLEAIATHRSALTAEEVVEVLRAGLQDLSPMVRERALLAVVGRAAGPRFSSSPLVAEAWLSENEGVQQLRPLVLSALTAQEGRVRLAAVLALGNLDYGGPGTSLDMLGPSTVTAFVAMSERDSDPNVRAEALKAIALTSNDNTEVRRAALRGITDSAAGVRGAAATAVARLKPEEGLARLVEALSDPDASVRLAVAKAFRQYGSAAAAHADKLRVASDNETVPQVRSELARALEAIR